MHIFVLFVLKVNLDHIRPPDLFTEQTNTIVGTVQTAARLELQRVKQSTRNIWDPDFGIFSKLAGSKTAAQTY